TVSFVISKHSVCMQQVKRNPSYPVHEMGLIKCLHLYQSVLSRLRTAYALCLLDHADARIGLLIERTSDELPVLWTALMEARTALLISQLKNLKRMVGHVLEDWSSIRPKERLKRELTTATCHNLWITKGERIWNRYNIQQALSF